MKLIFIIFFSLLVLISNLTIGKNSIKNSSLTVATGKEYKSCVEFNSKNIDNQIDCNYVYKQNRKKLNSVIGDYLGNIKKNYLMFMKQSEELNTQYNFKEKLSNKLPFANLLTKDSKDKITKDFLGTLKSDKLSSDIREQLKMYNSFGYKQTIEDINKFNEKEKELALNDKLIVEESNKLHDAIIGFTRKHSGEYLQSGVISPNGNEVEGSKKIVDYVKKEAQYARDIFKDDNENKFTMNDLDKLIKFK